MLDVVRINRRYDQGVDLLLLVPFLVSTFLDQQQRYFRLGQLIILDAVKDTKLTRFDYNLFRVL